MVPIPLAQHLKHALVILVLLLAMLEHVNTFALVVVVPTLLVLPLRLALVSVATMIVPILAHACPFALLLVVPIPSAPLLTHALVMLVTLSIQMAPVHVCFIIGPLF